jgi:parallel beta-helix repeat protein
MEKRKTICGLLVIGVFFLVTPARAVSVDCSTQSLQTAINLNPGANFNVTGTCNENIYILGSGVTIDGGGTAIINGINANNATVSVLGQLVTVTGFTISGGSSGIVISAGANATIDNNTIQNTGGDGIDVKNSNAVIINNTISNNPGSGISVNENSSSRIGFSSAGDTIASPNIIQNNSGSGIDVDRSSSARIVGNTIGSNAFYGITVFRSSWADISGNTINNNGSDGIFVGMSSGVTLGNPTGTTIFDLPNSTTVGQENHARGINFAIGAYVYGRLGTLNGINGAIDSAYSGIKTSYLTDVTNDYGIDVLTASNGLMRLGNALDNNTTKAARMVVRHYTNAEEPVYLFGAASTATDNFVAFGGGSTLGNAATQLDLFTAPNTTTPIGTSRITIKGNGYVGFGTQTPSYPLQMASGAHVTTGGIWTDASSREYKDNIEALGTEEAFDALKELNPVKFAYKADRTEKHVGFIAEDAPDLIAAKDRKGLSPMDIVAVLTKVVQEQQRAMQEQQKIAQEQRNAISLLKEELNELKGKIR